MDNNGKEAVVSVMAILTGILTVMGLGLWLMATAFFDMAGNIV